MPLEVKSVVLAPPAAVKRPEAMVELACELNPFTSVRNPVESKVEVAVPPKYALSNTERRVVEACVANKRLVDVEKMKLVASCPSTVPSPMNNTEPALPLVTS